MAVETCFYTRNLCKQSTQILCKGARMYEGEIKNAIHLHCTMEDSKEESLKSI